MLKIRVAIDSNVFNEWGGGIDFIAMIAEALESVDEVETYLVVSEPNVFDVLLEALYNAIIRRWSLAKCLNYINSMNTNNEKLFNTFRICAPEAKILPYKVLFSRLLRNREKREEKCLLLNDIDIILPSAECKNSSFAIPRIGYISDFQYKYLPDFFSEDECSIRELSSQRQLQNSNYVLVNSNSVKNDIKKFFPESECEVIVLPFKPFQKPRISESVDLSKYHLPNHYYVICNQFWMHKSHITAFEALEKLYDRGFTDLHIVCTGKVEDYRSTDYIDKLLNRIDMLNCKNNIHLLGYIPKDDQIAVMRGAIGLIQPTLFEGGPGGGSVYNAICLGMTCLVSDIPVNREIVGIDNVFFFEKEDPNSLAALMELHINDRSRADEETDLIIERNRREFGQALLMDIKRVISHESQKT